MEKRGGLWFGWSGAVVPSGAGRTAMVERRGAVDYATIDLTQEEHDRYYNAFSNGVLWPLLHTMPELMQLRPARRAGVPRGQRAAGHRPAAAAAPAATSSGCTTIT